MPTNTWTDIIFRVAALHLVDVSEIRTGGSARAIRKFCPPPSAGRPDSIPPAFSRT